MSEATHQVIWDGDIATFLCDGDLTADCHNYPACECETWDLEAWPDGSRKHRHPDVQHAQCWRMDWLEAADPEDTYAGEPLEMRRRDGLIKTRWETGFLQWSYVGDPS